MFDLLSTETMLLLAEGILNILLVFFCRFLELALSEIFLPLLFYLNSFNPSLSTTYLTMSYCV